MNDLTTDDNDLTTDDLIRYVLGDADPGLSVTIERRAATDTVFAAKLDLMARSVGLPLPGKAVEISEEASPVPNARRRLSVRWRRAAAVLALLLLGGGLTWAAKVLLTTPALLEDHFESNWGNIRVWRTPRRVVKFEDGHVRFLDRGYLVTAEEYPGPIDLSFRWRWTDLSGDIQYRDNLTVALRTAGVPRTEFSYEATDGVVVTISATGGKVGIGTSDDRKWFLDTGMGSLPLPAEEWHHVRITDDGETVSVYVTGSSAPAQTRQVPTARVKVPRQFPRHHIAIYNRERLASASHESWIDDVILRRLEGTGDRSSP